jgi:sugar O-acyltransferase (sialic acid O-acetyltransferase NeuD family)
MKGTLAIIGAGHLGSQIANIAISDHHFREVVFFDDFNHANEFQGNRILGPVHSIHDHYSKNNFDEVMIGVGYQHFPFREKMFNQLIETNIPLATIIHSSVYLDSSAKIGQGSIIYPRACIDQNVDIKNNVLINLNATLSHDSVVGSHSFIAPGVVISGFCKLDEKIFVGANSTLIDHIKLTSSVFIGAHSFVQKSITESGKFVGNPLKKIS